MSPRIAYYGDDFTGATDTLATASRAGLRAMLFLRVPSTAELAAAGELDCLGIAGISRSLDPGAMTRELAPVAAFFAKLKPRFVHYKTCSTFDSAPHVGNIAHAIAQLRAAAPNPLVAIVGGQPNLRRYCLYANLFAAAGIDGDIHRIDRHPTMSRHPVTPMTEADLRRHLAVQGLTAVLSVPYTEYVLPPDALAAAIDARCAQDPSALLFDVSRQSDLATIGRLLRQRTERGTMLAVGPSSVVDALASTNERPAPAPAAARGPVFVLAGSLSPVTREQLRHAPSFARVELDAAALIAGEPGPAAEIDALLKAGRHVVAATHMPEGGSRNPRDVAKATGAFLGAVLRRNKLHRIGIAGGDTSSYAVGALDIWGLTHAGDLAAGAPLCRARSNVPALDGLEVMLKGGQMGPNDIFERLVRGA
jgi:uncharacterized protein YgbK (DUF1537 family)